MDIFSLFCYPGRRLIRNFLLLVLGVALFVTIITYSTTTSSRELYRRDLEQQKWEGRNRRLSINDNGFNRMEEANEHYINAENNEINSYQVEQNKPSFNVEVMVQPVQPYRGARYNGAYNPADKNQDGVYIDQFRNEEIEIEKELREELWPQQAKGPYVKRTYIEQVNKDIIDNTNNKLNEEIKVEDDVEISNRLYVDSIGQVGSQLFQYASLYAIARETGKDPYLSHRSMLPKVFQGISVSRGFDPKVRIYIEEGPGIYSPSLYKTKKGDLAICCYLQSWRYFRKYANDLRNHLTIKDDLFIKAQKDLYAKLQDFIRNLPDNRTGNEDIKGFKTKSDYTQTDGYNVINLKVDKQAYSITPVGVHIHRLGLSQRRQLQGFKRAPPGYLRKAMDFIRDHHKNAVFVVLGDDVRWCRHNMSLYANGTNDAFVSGYNAGSTDLAMMTMMKHNIITTGAFGWWGAWLSEGNVIYYPNWITPGSEAEKMYKLRDYYPPWWMALNTDDDNFN